jgi:hypothetical protein
VCSTNRIPSAPAGQATGGHVPNGRPDWPPESVICRGCDEPNLRVLEVVVLDDPEVFDGLIVEPV